MRQLSWGMGWIVKALLFASDWNSIRKFQEWGYKDKWIMKLKWCDKNAVFFSQSLDSASSIGFVLHKLLNIMLKMTHMTPPICSDNKEPTCNVGDPCLIPGLGRSTGEGNDNPFQYSCLENSMDRRAWWALGVSMGWHRVGHNWMINTPPQVSNFRHA